MHWRETDTGSTGEKDNEIVMIHIKRDNIDKIASYHYEMLLERIRERGKLDIITARAMEISGVTDLRSFILADVKTMREWVQKEADKLKFKELKDIYNSYFSNGEDKYVFENYNAFKLLELLDIPVCPYCEDEKLDVVFNALGKRRRTSEIDHFFDKGTYPALAMNFYNLVPSGQNCNGLKMQQDAGSNPYEEDIEEKTFIYPDIPVGVNIESLTEEDIVLSLHASGGMERNDEVFALTQRYQRMNHEAYRLLGNVQKYPPEKIKELVNMGIFASEEELIENIFGPVDAEIKKKSLHQKMLRDITGY